VTTDRHTTSPRATALGPMQMRIDGLDFIASRSFDAPRELVFRAWSDCAHLVHWWGPAGWTLPVCKMDFRPDGTWLYCMRGPEGETSCGTATFHEIVEPERIVYTDAFTDADGVQIADTPEMAITVTFAESEGRTLLTSIARFASAKDLEFVVGTGMEEGLTETWDRLEAYLTAN